MLFAELKLRYFRIWNLIFIIYLNIEKRDFYLDSFLESFVCCELRRNWWLKAQTKMQIIW